MRSDRGTVLAVGYVPLVVLTPSFGAAAVSHMEEYFMYRLFCSVLYVILKSGELVTPKGLKGIR
jgi:hypothetical protein